MSNFRNNGFSVDFVLRSINNHQLCSLIPIWPFELNDICTNILACLQRLINELYFSGNILLNVNDYIIHVLDNTGIKVEWNWKEKLVSNNIINLFISRKHFFPPCKSNMNNEMSLFGKNHNKFDVFFQAKQIDGLPFTIGWRNKKINMRLKNDTWNTNLNKWLATRGDNFCHCISPEEPFLWKERKKKK